jgi:hypothetical protein
MPATSLTDFRLAVSGARVLGGVPSFLHHRLTPRDALAIVPHRLANRQEVFLTHLRRVVFDVPSSPYRELFRAAGIEYGDVARLVRSEGIEGALRRLFRDGVYLSVDEFKGRHPARRGTTVVAVTPEALRNPLAVPHLPARTSGSRSAGTRILFDLAFIRGCAVNTCAFLEARGGTDWVRAIWESPGAGARYRLLKYSAFGPPPYWFSQIDPGAPQVDPLFRWSERALRLSSRLAGVPLPRARHVSLTDPMPIARWMRRVRAEGRTPYMFTFPSSAMLLSQAAVERGADLEGAQFTLGGEPLTEARLDAVRQAGATALPRYGSMECGPIAYGCLRPDAPDDVHVLSDLHAVIQPDDRHPDDTLQGGAEGPAARPLYVTALHPRAPFVMLNVSMGDQAVMAERSCGCPLDRPGWTIHLRAIRSYEKLTGAGVTFHDADVIRVLEVVLPGRFGGTPLDYQLLEEETGGGDPRLRLLVHPRLGGLDERAIVDAFLSGLDTATSVAPLMVRLWREIGILRVERQPPSATASGKILHFHSSRRLHREGSVS